MLLPILLVFDALILPSLGAQKVCFFDGFVRLSGSQACRVSYLFRGNRFCFTENTWQQILENQQSCGFGLGKWRTTSWLDNSVSTRRESKVVRKVFYVKEMTHSEKVLSLSHSLIRKFEEFRLQLSGHLKVNDTTGLLRWMLLSENSNRESLSFLRSIGFVHLSVAGIHLYAIARLIFSVLFHMSISFRFPLSIGRQVAGTISFLIWALLWGLQGFRAGLLRPWIVVVLRSIGLALGFRWKLGSPLLISLSVDGLYAVLLALDGNPDAWAPGRLHYALAVGGGLAAIDLLRSKVPARYVHPKFDQELKTHFSLSLGSWLPTALLDVWNQSLLATFTPLLSLVSVPFFSVVSLPLLLLGALLSLFSYSLAETVFCLTNFLTQFSVLVLLDFSVLFSSVWVISRGALVGGIVLASFFLNREKRGIFALVAVVRICVEIYLNHSIGNSVWVEKVEQLDVGQGDSAIVTFWSSNILADLMSANSGVLVDTGGERVLLMSRWLEILSRRGLTGIRGVLLTHEDEDHSGGLEKLKKLMTINCVETIRSRACAFREKKGVMRLEVHAPSGRTPRPNENMLGLYLITRAGVEYLNLGDADRSTEFKMLSQLKISDRSDYRVLKVSHHGSRYSTSQKLIESFKADEAWISVGGNRYGHPTTETIHLLRKNGIKVFRTDQSGSLVTTEK